MTFLFSDYFSYLIDRLENIFSLVYFNNNINTYLASIILIEEQITESVFLYKEKILVCHYECLILSDHFSTAKIIKMVNISEDGKI